MNEIEVVLHAGFARIDGEYYIRLPNLKARIMWLLARRPGGLVKIETMIEHCWAPDDEPDDPKRRLNQEIQELRDALEPFGLAIRCRRRFGYWLAPARSAARHGSA